MDASFRPGDLLDHYRLNSLVATSGMARVFRATDTRTGSPVAIKIPHPRRRFTLGGTLALERKITQTLSHPGIVRILANGGAPRNYTVMEWIDGPLLRQMIESRDALSIERSVHLAHKISDILVHIHSRGFVHLDLKPDNVMVNGEDEIKLIDFDLARPVNRGFPFLSLRRCMGTPDYASPEQIRGSRGDFRSDVYSLGLILYEMLTGDVPFAGVAPAIALKLRVSSDPPSPAEVNAEVTPELDRLVVRAISCDPARRPATARAFCAELADIEHSCARELAPTL